MTIAIDMVATNLGSGTKTYNLNFCRYLNQIYLNKKIYIFVSKNYKDYIKDYSNKNIRYIIKPNLLSNIFFRIIWMQFFLPFELKSLKVDKLFSPMNFGPILLKLFNIKFILALHSNLPWVFFSKMPGNKFRNFFTKFLMEISIIACDTLIVDSKFAKEEIIKLLKIKKDKVLVVYLGIDKKYINKNKNNNYLNDFDYKNYIISVMSCVKYHNVIDLLKAFKLLKSDQDLDLKFVFVMQVLDLKYFKEIKKFIKKNFSQNEIILLDNLDGKYLANLYQRAQFYIFSSYCEVFGLTSLEAMSQGCPVMISQNSALPEINDNAAIYFNPDDFLEIKEVMKKVLMQPNFKKELIEKGNIRYKQFNWDSTVKETLKILNI